MGRGCERDIWEQSAQLRGGGTLVPWLQLCLTSAATEGAKSMGLVVAGAPGGCEVQTIHFWRDLIPLK